MKYRDIKSIMLSGKRPIVIREASVSFFVVDQKIKPYIEPTFQKIIIEVEKPTIILVSAVGSTGKTTFAKQLSYDTGLPFLDLSKHKPVGADTLTGLLTHAFDPKDIGAVFEGLASGSYGVIIDGIDEGRSKTTAKAFEAFLDDVVRLCKSSSITTFLLLGRTQILEDCWTYLDDKGIQTALITISPFNITSAKQYIDEFTDGAKSDFASQYEAARDLILGKLGKAFSGTAEEQAKEFLSFIGYPPVLDAIATLLAEEKNYHKLIESLEEANGSNVEINLLNRIATYILQREKKEKAIPNIIEPLVADASPELRTLAVERAFSVEEQCIRLVAHCLGKQVALSRLGHPVLDEKYEAQLAVWLPEHPFIEGQRFRNVVFEAIALATVATSQDRESESLLSQYFDSHKHSYYLIYMLEVILADQFIPLWFVGPLLAAAMEFRSVHSFVELRVNGRDWDWEIPDERAAEEIEIEIEVLLGADKDITTRTFLFKTEITRKSSLSLGSRLADASISVPCQVLLGGRDELELTAPIEIRATSVTFNAKTLVLKSVSGQEKFPEVIIEANHLVNNLESIITNQVRLVFALADATGVIYPAIKHVVRRLPLPTDALLRQKYLRLKRILVEFRSHGRGQLARYKGKIENVRVLRNDFGQAVLKRLVDDRILVLRDEMYVLDQEELNRRLGITWHDLHTEQIPESLISYLARIT